MCTLWVSRCAAVCRAQEQRGRSLDSVYSERTSRSRVRHKTVLATLVTASFFTPNTLNKSAKGRTQRTRGRTSAALREDPPQRTEDRHRANAASRDGQIGPSASQRRRPRARRRSRIKLRAEPPSTPRSERTAAARASEMTNVVTLRRLGPTSRKGTFHGAP